VPALSTIVQKGNIVEWIVELIEYKTDKVVKEFVCNSERAAERIDGGLNINLNHAEYYTIIKSPETAKE
jgi:hypothetical protein